MKITRAWRANSLCLHSSNAVHDKGNTTSNWLFSTGGLQCIMSSLKYTTTQRLNFLFWVLLTRLFQVGPQLLYWGRLYGISTYQACSFISKEVFMLRGCILPLVWTDQSYQIPSRVVWGQAAMFISLHFVLWLRAWLSILWVIFLALVKLGKDRKKSKDDVHLRIIMP